MDSTQQFIAEQEAVAGPDRDALEALAKQKRLKYLLYHRKMYDNNREKVLAKRKAAYQPTGRPVGRPRLPRE
jgi:hypothetical protein